MPQQRFGRESVLDAALEIVRERGHEVLSARVVAERAGWDGLMHALYEHARAWVRAYNVEHAGDGENLFASNGLAHMRLAREESQLFGFLYLSPYLDAHNLEELYASVSQPGVEECIVELGHLSPKAAHELYLNMIVYTHGLAVMLATGTDIPDGEIAERIFTAFSAFAIAVGGNPRAAR